MLKGRSFRFAMTLALLGVAFNASAQRSTPESDFGVLIMAHGGSAQWNQSVLEAVAPLESDMALEVAFGMADAASIQESVTALERRGVQRIGVVRLFISGDSWYERTGQILGLTEGAPPRPHVDSHASEHSEHSAGQGHSMQFWRVESQATFAMSRDGLIDAPEVGTVLRERVRALSVDPAAEDVLVIAHGPQDDAEDARWLELMEQHAAQVRAEIPVHATLVTTLREDWPEKRAAAEVQIREFVTRATAAGRTTIVIPLRVSGFGPYAEVLEGLDYVSDGMGLVPHPGVTQWIERQAQSLR